MAPRIGFSDSAALDLVLPRHAAGEEPTTMAAKSGSRRFSRLGIPTIRKPINDAESRHHRSGAITDFHLHQVRTETCSSQDFRAVEIRGASQVKEGDHG